MERSEFEADKIGMSDLKAGTLMKKVETGDGEIRELVKKIQTNESKFG